MAQPEKISIWDRWFNRTRKTVVERGEEQWFRRYTNEPINQVQGLAGKKIPNSEYLRNWVEYSIVDRVTGSEEIVREYLN